MLSNQNLTDKEAAIKALPLLVTKIIIRFDGVFIGPWKSVNK